MPFLLAGPIVRRVEKNCVYIWLTTSNYIKPKALLYAVEEKENAAISYIPIDTKTDFDMIQSGKHLYTYLLKITPNANQFPLDKLIGYNIEFQNRGGQVSLTDIGLLSKDNPNNIVYGNLQYPTFIIQHDSPSNILYGSCQKPHGKKQSAIVKADTRIEQHALRIQERPNTLFLMGDQIYADDVADPLFYKLKELSQQIIGEHPQNLEHLEPELKMSPFNKGIDQINGRQFIMDTFANFTSNNASNHLIRFQEYATMYLLTLGPSLWENNSDFPAFNTLIKNDEYYVMFSKHKERKRKREIKQLKKQYKTQLKELKDFIPTLPAIRRVLANTSTYMIFDDHDITDDWNISKEWIDLVNLSTLGKHTVTNGLAAYWLFQGWGNDPISSQPNLSYFSSQFRYHLNHSLFPNKWTEQLPNMKNWCFVTPTNPKALFLDIRTMRNFDHRPNPLQVGRIYREGSTAPQLIGNKGWLIVTRTLSNSRWKTGDPLIIVSPTPLYGLGLIESFLKRFVYPLRVLGFPVHYALDFEAWKYNGRGFNQFIQYLLKWRPDPCIILSGDVHYSCAVRSTIYRQDKKQITINQFTSSPIHNMSFTGIWGQILKLVVSFKTFSRRRKAISRSCDQTNKLTLGRYPKEQSKGILWHEIINYLSPPGGKILHNQNNIGLLKITNDFMQNMLLKQNSTVTYSKNK